MDENPMFYYQCEQTSREKRFYINDIYRFNKLDFGEVAGLPKLLDVG